MSIPPMLAEAVAQATPDEILRLAIKVSGQTDRELAFWLGCTADLARAYRTDPGGMPIEQRVELLGLVEWAQDAQRSRGHDDVALAALLARFERMVWYALPENRGASPRGGR